MADNKVNIFKLPIGLLFSGQDKEAEVKNHLKDNPDVGAVNCGTGLGIVLSLTGMVLAGSGIYNENNLARNVGILSFLAGLPIALVSWYTRVIYKSDEPDKTKEKTVPEQTQEEQDKADKTKFYEKLIAAKNNDELNSLIKGYSSPSSSDPKKVKVDSKVLSWIKDYIKAEKENMRKDYTDINDTSLKAIRNAFSVLKEFNNWVEADEILKETAKDCDIHPIIRKDALDILESQLGSDQQGREYSIYSIFIALLENADSRQNDKQWKLTNKKGNVEVGLHTIAILDKCYDKKNLRENILFTSSTPRALIKLLKDPNEDPAIRAKVTGPIIREKFNKQSISYITRDEIVETLKSEYTPKEVNDAILSALKKYCIATSDLFLKEHLHSIREILNKMKESNVQNIDPKLLSETIIYINKIYKDSCLKSEYSSNKKTLDTLTNKNNPPDLRNKAIDDLTSSIHYGDARESICNEIIARLTDETENEQVRTNAGVVLIKELNIFNKYNWHLESFDFNELDIDKLLSCINNKNDKCSNAKGDSIKLLEYLFKKTRNAEILETLGDCAFTVHPNNPTEVRTKASEALSFCSMYLNAYDKSKPNEYTSISRIISGFVGRHLGKDNTNKAELKIIRDSIETLGNIYRSTEDKVLLNTLIHSFEKENCDLETRKSIARVLGRTGEKDAIKTLIDNLNDKNNPEFQEAAAYGLKASTDLWTGGGLSDQLAWLMGAQLSVPNLEEKRDNILDAIKPLMNCIFDKDFAPTTRVEASEALARLTSILSANDLKNNTDERIKAIRDSYTRLKELAENPNIDLEFTFEFHSNLKSIIDDIGTKVFGEKSEKFHWWEQYQNYTEDSGKDTVLTKDQINKYLKDLQFSKDEDPSSDEIKKRYRKLAKENHPDKNPGPADDPEIEATIALFKAATEAYDKLYDWKVEQEKNMHREPEAYVKPEQAKSEEEKSPAGLTNKG